LLLSTITIRNATVIVKTMIRGMIPTLRDLATNFILRPSLTTNNSLAERNTINEIKATRPTLPIAPSPETVVLLIAATVVTVLVVTVDITSPSFLQREANSTFT
jgi:hypothetical protein